MLFFFLRHVGHNNDIRRLLQNLKLKVNGPTEDPKPKVDEKFDRHDESPYNRQDNPLLNSPASSPSLPEPPSASHSESASDSHPPLSAPGSGVTSRSSTKKNNQVPILAGVIGGAAFLILSIGIYLCKINKVANVRPWATGLSGQLQKAFVTGKSKHFPFTKFMRVKQWLKKMLSTYTCLLYSAC